MRDLVERAELDAAHSRIRLLEAQLRMCQQDAAEAHQSADMWQREALRRARVIGQLRQQLERQNNGMAETCGGTSRPVTAHTAGGEHVEAV